MPSPQQQQQCIFVCVYLPYQVLSPLMQHRVVQPLTYAAKGCVTLVGQWTVCCRSQGRPTCVVVRIFSFVRNSCGGILAQANNSRSFAIDVSRAGIPPKAPNEMWWTQTRTLEWAVLHPITHLPRQPCSLHSPWHRIFCSLCVHRTSSLETGNNGNTLAQGHPFMCWLCPSSAFCILQNPLHPPPCLSWCSFQVGAVFIFLPLFLQQLLRWPAQLCIFLPPTSLYLQSRSLRSVYKGSDWFWEVMKSLLKLIKNLLPNGSCSSLRNHHRTVTERQLNVNCHVLFRLRSDGGREDLEMEKGVQLRETMAWAFDC